MSKKPSISKLANKILQDPILLQKLTDKVHEIMIEDLRKQREMNRSYGR
jgi:hypothetical protein